MPRTRLRNERLSFLSVSSVNEEDAHAVAGQYALPLVVILTSHDASIMKAIERNMHSLSGSNILLE
jgi:hypothetical protein